MDSEDDLPALESVENDRHMPPPVNAQHAGPSIQPFSDRLSRVDTMADLEPHSDNDQLPPVNNTRSDWDDDENMPALMSVSDSSEERDEFGDDGSSEWEDEDDGEFQDEDSPQYYTAEDAERMPPSPGMHPLNPTTPPNHHHSSQIDPSQQPPSHTPEQSPNFFTGGASIRTMLDHVLHSEPIAGRASVDVAREMLEHMLLTMARDDLRMLEPDPGRAKVLVQGLDIVPEGLLKRMARVGGAPGAHEDLSGDDESAMAGCAVCWAPLLDSTLVGLDDEQAVPFSSEVGERSNIVSLPCAHVFHSACLLPWFLRPNTTTCPTCRFDIDPNALTWKPLVRSRVLSTADDRTISSDGATVGDWEDQLGIDVDDVESDNDFGGFVNDELLFTQFLGNAGFSRPEVRSPRPQPTWTVPAAPGKTLRERIMDKERDMGIRCADVACVLAPTDERPVSHELDTRQISIQTTNVSKCKHTLHPACLVMSARVAGCSPSVDEGETHSAVEVSCPSCRTVGTVSRQDWDEGVKVLALVDF